MNEFTRRRVWHELRRPAFDNPLLGAEGRQLRDRVAILWRSDEHELRGVWSGPLQVLWADLGHGAAPPVEKADSGGKGQDAVSLEPARTAVGKVTPTYRGVKS